MPSLKETCYMHITCTFFVHHFFKSTIRFVWPTCKFLWNLQIQWLIYKSDVQNMYNWYAKIIFLFKHAVGFAWKENSRWEGLSLSPIYPSLPHTSYYIGFWYAHIIKFLFIFVYRWLQRRNHVSDPNFHIN